MQTINFAYREKEFSADITYYVNDGTKVVTIELNGLRDENGVDVRKGTPWWNGVNAHLKKECHHGERVDDPNVVIDTISALSAL